MRSPSSSARRISATCSPTGTEQEVAFLVAHLGWVSPACAGRRWRGLWWHSLVLAARGFEVVGIDLSPDFVALALCDGDLNVALAIVRPSHWVMYGSSKVDGEFDAVWCLCQGGFVCSAAAKTRIGRWPGFACWMLSAGGRLALSAFSAYFAVRHLDAGEEFDAAHGVNHEVAAVRGPGAATSAGSIPAERVSRPVNCASSWPAWGSSSTAFTASRPATTPHRSPRSIITSCC